MPGVTGRTRLYPIIGDPIVYARSPITLTEGFAARGHDAACVPMQVSAEALDPVMKGLTATPNVDGLLITMPHKFTAFPYCATASDTAKRLQVVSITRRNRDGSWHAENTDGLSFVKAQIDHGAQVKGARALLFGAGGAGSAIAIALLRSGVKEIVVHDLDAKRVAQLDRVTSDFAEGRLKAGSSDPSGFDLVFNATPMGMSDDDAPPFDLALLKPSMFVGDVIAGHGETKLIKAARLAGCKYANGDQMVDAVREMMLDFMLEPMERR